MSPIFFSTQIEFRQWLEINHTTKSELMVGFYKVSSGKPSMTWSQSVDQALCYGWIDGVRRSIDNISYTIRFTPRRIKSIWSAVNIKKVDELIKQNLMQPVGLELFNQKEESRSKIYAYENEALSFSEDFEKQFKENINAWEFFQKQAPSYKKTLISWVMMAKQDITKIKRLEKLIKGSESGQKV